MRHGTVMRRVSRLGSLGAYRSALCRLDGEVWHVQKRALCLVRWMRGVHDVVGHALALGEYITGVRSSTSASQSSRPWRTQSSRIRDLRYGPAKGYQTSSPPSSSPPAPPTADPTSPASLSEQVRCVMRLLPNPVVVCTSIDGNTPRAMTMSSFTSLTLSPTPLISFNIATPSRTLDAISSSRHFNIHIMAGDAHGVAMADRFTRGNAEDVFNGVQCDTTREGEGGGAPLLKDEGVLYVLRCRLLPDEPTRGLVKVRDHVIVVGEVVEMIPGSCKREFGLAYADRRYRQVGDVISKGGS